MGALLNNSNGCPRMPIRNTTAIKAMSILGAEWRPCSKWRHYSCYPREDAAALVFLLLLLVVDLFLYLFSGSKERCLGFEAGHICRGGKRLSAYFIPIWIVSLCSLQGETHSVGNWVRKKKKKKGIVEAALQQSWRYKHAEHLHQPPPPHPLYLAVVSYLSSLIWAVLWSVSVPVWDLRPFTGESVPSSLDSDCIEHFNEKKRERNILVLPSTEQQASL